MLKIETWDNNPILRAVAQEIGEKDYKDAIKLWKEMLDYLKSKENSAIGLAAPQIGQSIRLIAVWLPKSWDAETYKTIFMINPVVLEHSTDTECDTELCLSVPWEKWEVNRFKKIKVNFIDKNKKPKTLILEWLQARIVQHEVDHLNGILFTDYLK